MGILYGKYAQGQNSLSTKELFLERAFYKHYVDANQGFPPLDLWEAKHHYGRADYWHTAVYPSEYNLKQIPTQKGTIFALDFVADAFMAFREEYKNMSLGTIAAGADSFFVGEFEPKRGWRSIHKDYHVHMTTMFKTFTAFINMSPERTRKMSNFDNYIKMLWQFFDTVLPAFPITRTGYIYSKYCNPRVSGLILEIMKVDHDKDLPKEYMFEDINFQAYAGTANKHGFYVDRNAPWRLVAKIGSSKLEPYMRDYGITSLAPFGTTKEIYPNGQKNYLKKNVSFEQMLAGEIPASSEEVSGLNGETSVEAGHNHIYYVDSEGNGYAHLACHDKYPEVCHGHVIENWQVLPANSQYDDPIAPRSGFNPTKPPWGQNSSDPERGIANHIHATLPPKNKPSYKAEVSYENVFKKYFYQSFLTDIDVLKVYARSFYNSFVATNTFIRVPATDYCDSEQATRAFYRKVKGATKEEVDRKYQLPYWIRNYLKMRAKETSQSLSDKHLDYLMKRIDFQLKYRGPADALNLTNSIFEGSIRKRYTAVKNPKLSGYDASNQSKVDDEISAAMANPIDIIPDKGY